jgi:hypothetical protein
MAMVVLTRLHLLTLEQVAGRDVKPTRTCLHQLIAGDREAITISARSPSASMSMRKKFASWSREAD